MEIVLLLDLFNFSKLALSFLLFWIFASVFLLISSIKVLVISCNSPTVFSFDFCTLFSILSKVITNFSLIANKSPCFFIAVSRFFKEALTPSTFSAKTTRASLLVSVILVNLFEDCMNNIALNIITARPDTIEDKNITVVYL